MLGLLKSVIVESVGKADPLYVFLEYHQAAWWRNKIAPCKIESTSATSPPLRFDVIGTLHFNEGVVSPCLPPTISRLQTRTLH